VRDGWLHARGVADDKGNLHAIVRAALDLAAEGALPVDVRLICDGEEEIGGHSVIDHIAAIEEPIDAAIVFDSLMAAPRLPSLTTALRGIVGFQVRLRTNEREVHSGMFGGAAANALHDLMRTLAAVVDLPEPLRAGVEPPDEEELAGWSRLPAGARELSSVGAVPADERAADELYERTWAGPSLTVHSLAAGNPALQKTSIPPEASASLSLRLAPGQDAEGVAAELERLLREACPAHAQLELRPWPSAAPARIPLDRPELRAAVAALERATGVAPVTLRSGGSIPLVASLVERGIPVILSGFASALDNIHSPNERMELERLEWAYRSGRELFLGLK
jgi:acetylornithine deacetylase/succinyl-diaminopimelate desuccinylase-like protein